MYGISFVLVQFYQLELIFSSLSNYFTTPIKWKQPTNPQIHSSIHGM